ncbi:uncharacterized protein [Rutidosis leptorrhynchoides]|uniref:uncharacterized protein n=1 Tax=Rutidosis leptorrhynchoides TaxID=125765 RepID=UPI003A997DAE
MLSLFKEFDYLRIPYHHIECATNDFDQRNVIERFQSEKRGIIADEVGHYSYISVYRGQLFRFGKKINVIVEEIKYMPEDEFLKVVSMLSRVRHKNIATFVGFCYRKYIASYLVSECEIKASLAKIVDISSPYSYSSDSLESVYKNLTCSQRLKMCLGAARALSHIHDQKAVHSYFSSHKILLDRDLEAKVVGFVLIPPSRFPDDKFALYTDPVSKLTKTTTQESDVYSFGVVLIDVFCRQYTRLFGWIYTPQVSRIHHRDIDDRISKKMNSEASIILSETLNQCLNNERVHRPNMADVVAQLEKALYFQMKHENPKIIKIGLEDVKLATENFAAKYLIGSGRYGKVYKAELNIYDAFFLEIEGKNQKEIPKKRNRFSKFFLGIEGKTKKEISKKCHPVAIKHIINDENGHGRHGFMLEIEMLHRCNHPNIVSLIGYCDEDHELILVYEFITNGSLDDYLGSILKETYLNWVNRIKICLDIAHGLDYLHANVSDKERIIHRDIKSANILLGKNWDAKIGDFGLSKFFCANQLRSTIVTDRIVGTEVYLDPEYSRTGKLKKESDIYSFGVVLFEMFSGTLAYKKIYTDENNKGLAVVARRHFSEGTLMEIVDPEVMEEADEHCFGLKIGPNQKSLDVFSKIAFQCLAETQDDRPKLIDVTKELEIALKLQEKRSDIIKFSLEHIKLGTKNFSEKNFIRTEGSGKLYRGEVPYDSGLKTVILKVTRSSEEHNFLRELEILLGYKHENIIDIVGYCKDIYEQIIVYENAYNVNTLDSHVNDVSLTWTKRLEICIGIANGLKFLYKGFARQQSVVHRDIKSANIILNEKWTPKISCFEFSLITPKNQKMEYVINDVAGSPDFSDPVYCDPVYEKTGFLTMESDIYSFGVVLFEMLCGTLACIKDLRESKQFQDFLVDDIVFEGIKEQIEAKSLATFVMIAYQCLHEEREKRPKADEVYMQLKKALDIQVLKDRLVVKKDLYLLKLIEGGNLSDHIVTFNRLVLKLSNNINEIMTNEDLALLLLLSLPKSYNLFVDNMLTGSTSLKLKDVLQKLSDYNVTNESSYMGSIH